MAKLPKASIVYYAGSTANAYARIVSLSPLQVWDDDSDALADSPTWTNSAITLTHDSDVGGFPFAFPDDLPDGKYDVVFYENASPDDADEVKYGEPGVYANGVWYKD